MLLNAKECYNIFMDSDGMNIKNMIKNVPPKFFVFGGIGIGLIFLICLIFILTKDSKITKSAIEGYKNYYSKSLKISFDFPKDYKVKKVDDVLYVSKKFKGKEALEPYFKISIYDEYKSANEYLEKSTEESKKEYGNTFTPITEMLGTLIQDKFVSKMTYNNFYESKLIVENRYAYQKNNKIYVVSSYEFDASDEKNNNIIENIISTLEIL